MDFIQNYIDYVNAALAKGTIGAYISAGIFALIGVYSILGVYYGATRGFSKSVIRIFTVGASAVLSLFGVTTVLKTIVKMATEKASTDAGTVDVLLDSYFPGLIDSMPEMVKPLLSEINSNTATIFVMMIVAVLLTPVLFIGFFYILKTLSIFVYNLLAGLTGAISYGKSVLSTVLGAVVGLCQGVLIAAVIIVPISGLCHVAVEAREHLIKDTESPNAYIDMAYNTVIDDLADNPLFEIVDRFGGKVAYENMITVNINGEKMDMGEECVGAIKVAVDILPIATPDFNWKSPSEEQKQAFADAVVDVGNDELIASLAADIVRGVATTVKNGVLDIGLEGAAKTLVNDVMSMFSTTTRDTVEGDLDLLVDIYFIMCDRHLIDTFSGGSHLDIREMLTDKDENGKTSADVILDTLRAYDRAAPIVSSFTKISLSVMHGGSDFDEEAEQIYESVKQDITSALTHNKSDFETEEEYKEAVTTDLDKALLENNIRVEDDVKQGMVDYIAENYGDYEGEITDKEINDAILSYYQSYSSSASKDNNNQGSTDEGTTDEGTTDEGTTDEGTTEE